MKREILLAENAVLEKLLSDAPVNYSFKSFIAQFLATLASSTMFLGVGMMIAETMNLTLALPITNKEFNLNSEVLMLIGSQLYRIQPIGCIVGAILQNVIGRKTGVVVMNISALTSWVLLYTALSVDKVYASATMMGVSAGLMYAPGLAYIAEITEPRLRGAMIAFANITLPIGTLIVFYLGFLNVDWRKVSALSCCVPVISFIMFSFVPDSPLRLLKEGRGEDALQALRWLRGWTSIECVKSEFSDMGSYVKTSKNSAAETPKCSVMDFIRNPISTLFRRKMLKPFGFILLYRFFSNCATLRGAEFGTLGITEDPRLLPILSIGFMILGGLSCSVSVKFMGKRKLSLISILVCSVDTILLGAYQHYQQSLQVPWVPLILFCSLYFFNTLGVGSVSWMLVGEIFPARGRASGIGMSAAMFCVIDSIFERNYSKLEQILGGLFGCSLFYGIGGLIGFTYLYKCLPETEGKLLPKIERNLFSNKKSRSSVTWSSILLH